MSLKPWSEKEKNRLFRGALLLIVLASGLWSLHALLDSPRPWFDEGIYLQAAKNLAEEGRFGLQVMPGEFTSLSFITIGYPLLIPLGLIFFLVSPTLLVARLFMVGWIVACVWLTGRLGREWYGRWAGLYVALLLASFGPLYGNGKNVLGEVPGLVYLLAGCLLASQIEVGRREYWRWFLAGLFFGLAVATKPSFLPLLPSLGIVGFIAWRRRVITSWTSFGWFIFPLLGALLLWLLTQFAGVSVREVLNHYANPYGIERVIPVMRVNALNMLQNVTPLHFLGLLGAALMGWAIRLLNGSRLRLMEYGLGFFILLTAWSYLRTAGWYRYFFLAHVLLLLLIGMWLPLFRREKRVWLKRLGVFGLTSLVLLQIGRLAQDPTPLYGREWRELAVEIKKLPLDEEALFVNATEAVFFYPGRNYRQYLRITHRLRLGEGALDSTLPLPAYVVTNEGMTEIYALLQSYERITTKGATSIWKLKEKTFANLP